MYIESITEKLNNPNLQDPDNDGYKILDGTFCEYMEKYDNHLMDLFLTRAKGGYLDLHASLHNIFRHEDETDDELRARVLTDLSIVQCTSDFIGLDVSLWVYQSGVVDDFDTLTSRNPYLKSEHDTGYVFIACGSDSDYLKNKFVLEDVKWIS